MKKLLSLLSAVLFLNSSMVGADEETKKDIFADMFEEAADEVVLDQDIKQLLMHSLFSRYRASFKDHGPSTRGTNNLNTPLSNVNREDFKGFSKAFEASLGELVSKCQKNRATIDVMGRPFICQDLETFLIMTELKPSVLEVNDWSSFFFGGYSKEVQLSPRATAKLKRLKQNIVDAGSALAESKDLVRATLNAKEAAKKLKKNR